MKDGPSLLLKLQEKFVFFTIIYIQLTNIRLQFFSSPIFMQASPICRDDVFLGMHEHT